VLKVAVVGGINVDVFALVDRQPTDATPTIIEAVSEGAGGKGANQAVAAARLGCEVRLFGAVGDDDAGARVVGRLRAVGVDTRGVRTVTGAQTGRVVGFVAADGSKRTAALGGANLRITPEDIVAATGALRWADVIVVQLEPPAAVVEAVLRRAEVPTLLDLAPAQGPVRELASLATWVTANRGEAEVATGIAVHDEATASEAAARLRALGPAVAGVTAGSAGQVVASEGVVTWTPAPKEVPIVDTAGAGDAFAATLAVSLARGVDVRRAARAASAASTLACRRLGAQSALPTMAEIEAVLGG
jgi:ribokinase